MAGMDLGKQVGPLPLGAWIVVVGGGLAIAYWNRNQGGEPVIVEDTSGDPGVGEGPGWEYVGPPTETPDSGDVEYESNEAWGRAAINWLIAQGYSAGLASAAITKGLSGGVDVEGNKMSIQEWALWQLALTKFGSPPYPVHVPPPSSVPGPINPPKDPPKEKPPAPKPPSNKTPPYIVHKVKRGETLSGIAAKYGKTWQEVYNFNLKYRNPATAAIIRARGPHMHFAGTTWWIPR